jgi:8-oxo-(d)GTP phosphatase
VNPAGRAGLVRAAGGVLWRDAGDGLEVVLVHRPRYDDWSLPKGKLERGEHVLAAAVREVFEETGMDGVPQVRLPTIEYLTGDPGVAKRVDFWSMRVRGDHGRVPGDEISEVRWVPATEAPTRLSYAHDRGVVAAMVALPRVTNEILLVRHAHAGARKAWHGPDGLRPLDSVGRHQAERLNRLLRLFAPGRVVSASPIRCRDTVAPLGLPVKLEPAFDETSPLGTPGALAALRALAADRVPTVVCSQGKVIAPLLEALRPANGTATDSYQTPKGDGWLLSFAGTRAIAADRVTAAT